METRKLTYEWLIPVAVFFFGVEAIASIQTTLRQVQTVSGNQIHLLFDREIDKSQIKKEYFRDIVQLSLSNTSVYPAKIISVDGSPVSKVFAYQYTPNLVRCRLTVNGKAEDYENRVSVEVKGRSMIITVANPVVSDQITTQAAQKTKPAAAPVAEAAVAQRPSVKDDPETKKILERVLAKEGVKTPKAEAIVTKEPAAEQSPIRSFIWLGASALGFLLLAFMIRKFKGSSLKNRLANNGRFANVIGKLTGGAILRKPKMIEVVANHYLGPKKSIAVVKIQGRALVVGITDENINLITRFEEEFTSELDMDEGSSPLSGAGATAAGTARFGDLLKSEVTSSVRTPTLSAREQIRRKMEGLKNL